MKICPFLNKECLAIDCQIWDKINEKCGVKINSGRETLLLKKIDDILLYIKHFHNTHSHSFPHNCEHSASSLSMVCGHYSASSALPFASVLMQEYMNNEDFDRNGLIFGKDFIIDSNDPNCPRSIKGLGLYSNSKDSSDGCEIKTWDEYINTLSYGDNI